MAGVLDPSKGVEYNIEVILARRQARRRQHKLPDDSARLAPGGPNTAKELKASFASASGTASSLQPQPEGHAASDAAAPAAPEPARAPATAAAKFRDETVEQLEVDAAASEHILHAAQGALAQSTSMLVRGMSFSGAIVEPGDTLQTSAMQPVFVWVDASDPTSLQWVPRAALEAGAADDPAHISTLPLSRLTEVTLGDEDGCCRFSLHWRGGRQTVLSAPDQLARQHWLTALLQLLPLLGASAE